MIYMYMYVQGVHDIGAGDDSKFGVWCVCAGMCSLSHRLISHTHTHRVCTILVPGTTANLASDVCVRECVVSLTG
jgi:hypothetical protein